MPEPDPLAAALEPGESLLWTAAPPPRAYFLGPAHARPLFYAMAAVALGLIVAWVAAVRASSEAGMILAGFGLALVLFPVLALAGDVARSGERYGLTPRRLLIRRGGVLRPSLTILDLDALDGVVVVAPGLLELRLPGSEWLVPGASSAVRAEPAGNTVSPPAARGPRLHVDDAGAVRDRIVEASRRAGHTPRWAGSAGR